jgi:hypothetical protein
VFAARGNRRLRIDAKARPTTSLTRESWIDAGAPFSVPPRRTPPRCRVHGLENIVQ